ncbi:tRNA (uracil-O(2)-)-methyltransferase [Fusarium austroafricanum]|uniref:tRNA (uracil-O(2)-)-methyltransferase n=1 Tax=Fusarium austroafricanum TaxID=2364996 RepID=A0A8H4KE22_9HYPO|nr:tRNA (uracil-O(2)-)-methyltransferase [Fusarium austroafricanum]
MWGQEHILLDSDDFDLNSVKPLLNTALTKYDLKVQAHFNAVGHHGSRRILRRYPATSGTWQRLTTFQSSSQPSPRTTPSFSTCICGPIGNPSASGFRLRMEDQKKVPFEPEEFPPGTPHVIRERCSEASWIPMCSHSCTFETQHFDKIMLNLVENPNLNSKWLFRADVLFDDESQNLVPEADGITQGHPLIQDFQGFTRQRAIVRRLIPRNTLRDAPLDQTCSFYHSYSPEDQEADGEATLIKSLVVYIPHASSAADLPFYHPKVKGISQLHEWDTTTNTGTISVHFLLFDAEPAEVEVEVEVDQVKLGRIAYHLLQTIHKHGHSTAKGYVKRVHHDVVVPRERFQDKYSELKNKYARALVQSWLETTDPTKHVFEDLGIAAFLIELWKDMYKDVDFPGFVDIGCGNGLLVHILRLEGYAGWGFDARERKSWSQYNSPSPGSPSGNSLQRLLLLPSVIPKEAASDDTRAVSLEDIHDGLFPKDTFIISNHADELTPWTPVLAAISQCPFIMIPCCSHNLTGDRWRAPPPRDRAKPKSMFASLVDWVTQIAEDCGWYVETEMLRIPSTRNIGLVGRKTTKEIEEVDIHELLQKYGGVQGYYDNVVKLLKSSPRGH